MIYQFIKPFLFKLDPEKAHSLVLKTLRILHKLGLTCFLKQKLPPKPCHVMGIEFPNPVGLAAGLDRHAETIEPLAALGFGFIEVGTVTINQQAGHPKPRLFRLKKNQALINRMGFYSKGLDYFIEQLKITNYKGVLGINITKNFSTAIENALDDYLVCLRAVYPYASYIAINISSPNTPGLRNLQYGAYLTELLAGLKQEQIILQDKYQRYVPLVVKIAPDLNEHEIKQIAATLVAEKIDGVIATNTTISRNDLIDEPHIDENGGLSGKPLTALSLTTVKMLRECLPKEFPIIALGGIMSAKDAVAQLEAGANLVQIYTGLIYHGPELIEEIVNGLQS